MILFGRLCKTANDEHLKSLRQYAHVFHRDGQICLAGAAFALPPCHFWAIIAHEFGHVLAGEKAGEATANREAERYFGIKMGYIDSEFGENLEFITSDEVEIVKAKLTGKFVPTQAPRICGACECPSVRLAGRRSRRLPRR